eukprot:766923-Prymnesium_polylepis.1
MRTSTSTASCEEFEHAPVVNFAWDVTPAPPLSLEVRVPRSVFFYLTVTLVYRVSDSSKYIR